MLTRHKYHNERARSAAAGFVPAGVRCQTRCMADPRTLDRRDALWIAGVLLGLVVVRTAILLSVVHEIYDWESTMMGTLVLDLRDGDAVLWPLDEFRRTYRYGWFADGTLVIQLLTVALSPLLGPTGWAMHASTLVMELLLVGLWFGLLLRVTDRRWALLGTALLLFPALFAVRWHLLPFGNHSEFLWVVPAVGHFLVARDPDRRPAWHWLAPAALLLVVACAYRLSLAAVVALPLGLVFARSWRAAAPAAVAAVLVCAGLWALYGPWFGMAHVASSTLVDAGPRDATLIAVALDAPAALARGFWHLVPDLEFVTDSPSHANKILKPALLLFFAAAVYGLVRGRPRLRVLCGLSVAWALVALALPSIRGQEAPRYFLPALYGLLMCGGAGLATLASAPRPALAGVVGIVVVCGAVLTVPWIRPGIWDETARFDGLALGQRLGVKHVDLDDLPYYRRMLDEGRASPWVGLVPPPDPTGLPSRHHYPGSLPDHLAQAVEQMQLDGWEPRRELTHAGRGAYVAYDRDLAAILAHWEEVGVPQPWLDWMWEGATAEAAVWGE